MKNLLKSHAKEIYEYAISENMPNEAVKKALAGKKFDGRVILVSIGKAGWEMAKTASQILGDNLDSGIVITKYEHSKGKIENVEIYTGPDRLRRHGRLA